MLFSSITFLWLFLPIVFLLSMVMDKKYQNVFLVVASLLFYAWGEPVYVFLMIFSIILNYSIGILIENANERKNVILSCGIVLNIGILAYFKYYNFFVENINGLLGRELISTNELELPIGISFFTFQALSYIIDLYRGKYKAQKNLINMALYISFFPQLIAGPIVKYKDINEQIENRQINVEKVVLGIRRFSYGLGKKVLLANVLAGYVDNILSNNIESISPAQAWIAAIFYTFQIYYDFSGYSDMAIGLGKMFGFDFLENFNYPYLSKSIHEFWQRWHISLGTWFKEYVYIPLGGNRKGTLRTYINLSIVFVLTGLWHGANWTFILWGIYHGFFQIIERLGLEKILKRTKVLKHIYCCLVFTIGWVIFRADNWLIALRLISRMLMPWRHRDLIWSSNNDLQMYSIAILSIVFCGVLQDVLLKHEKISNIYKNSIFELLTCIVIVVLSFSALASNSYNPFIYFRF